ncbi:chromo domain-containing protein [Colletotrichum graminicola]|uniref:Chromo domain-containing protein n=1 Tax=Colletotrichum graminicola (strain M1.001 / M2 / FGSC 10212) TaxID=645133 RepID=E3Q7N1_COLGM|nr:chromo domain-containing protein [Colletotrichum graminicola M1.001]EFQ26893.1 chromo domain-containing protein [Colletotrichum graminicola M1.001]WDK16602.1 chromo domain-containing protein [Colletotrichum graminicola]
MARTTESPAPPNGTQPVKKVQTTLMHSAHNFLSSSAKPSGSQSPHPGKRSINIGATGTPRSDASPPHSPSSQRPFPHLPVSPSPRHALSDTAGGDTAGADGATAADIVIAAAPPAEPADAADTTPAPANAKEATPDAEAASSTPEPTAQRAGSNVLASVRKTLHSAVNSFSTQRTGTTTTVTSTFEHTVVSRKRSREPEAEETPAPAAEDNNIDAANGDDITIQLGDQLETEEMRAQSPVKEAVQVPSPAAEGAEINVATAADKADTDTVEAAAAPQDAAPEAVDDDDVEMDDHKAGVFVLDKIIGHRPDPRDKTLFQMQVSWKHGEPTWEPEQTIQEDAEEALFAYWVSVKGGRLGAMADKNLWHVLRIEKHKQKPSGAIHFLVYWIGSPDRSWEPESQVEVYARQHVENYWRSKGGREKNVKSVAMPVKRGRGRPSKATVSEPATEDEAPEETVKVAKPRSRPARKQKRDGTEDEAEKTEDAVTAEVDGEPPKKRARGRPRKNPVS